MLVIDSLEMVKTLILQELGARADVSDDRDRVVLYSCQHDINSVDKPHCDVDCISMKFKDVLF